MSQWRPGSRLWGHYWICQLLKHLAINQFTWSSKISTTTWYVQNWTTLIVSNVHINDKSSLVKIMACHRIGKKTTIWTSNDGTHRCIYLSPGLSVLIIYSITMLLKFRTSANQKHRIWSCDESVLCNPRLRLLGEVIIGSSIMFRKMEAWNIIRKHTAGQG